MSAEESINVPLRTFLIILRVLVCIQIIWHRLGTNLAHQINDGEYALCAAEKDLSKKNIAIHLGILTY